MLAAAPGGRGLEVLFTLTDILFAAVLLLTVVVQARRRNKLAMWNPQNGDNSNADSQSYGGGSSRLVPMQAFTSVSASQQRLASDHGSGKRSQEPEQAAPTHRYAAQEYRPRMVQRNPTYMTQVDLAGETADDSGDFDDLLYAMRTEAFGSSGRDAVATSPARNGLGSANVELRRISIADTHL